MSILRSFVAAVALVIAWPAVAQPVNVRVDWQFWAWHAPFFLGLEKGWYKEAGLEPAFKEGRGSGNVVQLVGNGTDTFGFAGADAVVRGVLNGIPVVSVATIMPRNADMIFALKSSGIAKVSDLKGRRIGTTPGGTSDALLPAFLRGAGLSTSDVTIVPVDATLKVQVLLQGKVDAINGPAWAASILKPGGTHVGFSYPDYGVEVVGYGIVVSTETAKTKPDLVTRFVAATLKSWAYAVDHPDEALEAMAKHVPEVARRRDDARVDLIAALALVKPAVAGKPFGTQSEADWDRMQHQLKDYGAVKLTGSVERYLTNRFLR